MRLPARSSALPAAGFALFAAGAGCLAYFGRGLAPAVLVLAACAYLVLWAAVARTAVRNLFGPVFVYEVTRLGRRRATFAFRFLYIAVVAVGLAWSYLVWREGLRWDGGSSAGAVRGFELAKFATQCFTAYAVLLYATVALLTPVYVAGSIADEKERKTLEFLLATDLSGYEIVFGKAAARVLTLLMYVLAGLPVLAFLQLFGGIDPDLLVACTAAAVVTILGFSAVGLFLSVRCRRPREAIAGTYLVLVLYLAVSFFGGVYVQFGLPRHTFDPFTVLGYAVDHPSVVAAVTPVADWLCAGNLVYQVPANGRRVWGGADPAAVINEVLGRYAAVWGVAFAVLMGLAVTQLRAVSLRQTYGAPRRSRDRAARARPPVGPDGVVWKEVFVDGALRTRAGSVGVLLLAGLLFVTPALGLVGLFGPENDTVRDTFRTGYEPFPDRLKWFRELVSGWLRTVTAAFGTLVLLGLAVRGAGSVSAERDRDTWVSLISTPLSAWEVVRAKWAGTVLGARRAYGLLVGVWAAGLAAGAVEPLGLLAAAATFAVYAGAFAWVGVFCSVTARTTLVATVRAVFVGLFVAGGFWLVPLFCCALPASVLFRGDPATREALDEAASLLAGLTPALTLSFLPAESFATSRMGPFDRRSAAVGPVAPIAGAYAWLLLAWLLGTLSWRRFARQANRREAGTAHADPPRPTRAPAAGEPRA